MTAVFVHAAAIDGQLLCSDEAQQVTLPKEGLLRLARLYPPTAP
jgi:hypothetical protein